MNVNGFTHKPTRTKMVRLFQAVIAGSLITGVQPSQAAAAKKFILTGSEVKTFEAWTDFLAKGTQTWTRTHAPPFSPTIRSTIWQVLRTDTQAQSIANPMIDYLEWRRSLDPTRFTNFHPRLSPELAQLLNTPSLPLPTGVPPPTFTPVPETAPQALSNPATPSAAQALTPPPVPEPSSLLLAASMTGWGIWWRHRLAKPSSR